MKAGKEMVTSGLACVNLTSDVKKAISSMQGNEILKKKLPRSNEMENIT